MALSLNSILNHRFRIIRLLGQGGMGAVYYAFDPVLDRHVAIKQLQPDPTNDEHASEQVRNQFLREARSLAALHHPNLPRVTDYFVDDGMHYLVMDYIEGQSLQDIVQANQYGLAEDQVLEWADQLLSALDYIHQHNLIHRDVKPANIRRTPDGRIFLVDFGLVKSYDVSNPKTLTMFHSRGTLEYAPPEQFDPLGHTDQRSDIYSLGATLYHLLTGDIPVSVTRRISDPDSFHTLRQANASVSPEVERVILRAMELERTKRFASAAEMRAALQYIRQSRAVDAGHTAGLAALPVASAAPPRRQRRRLVAFMMILILLVAGCIIGFAALQSNTSAIDPTLTASPTPTISAILAATSTVSPTLEPSPTPTPTQSPTPTLILTVQASATPLPTTVNPSSNPPQNQPAPTVAANPTPGPQNTPPGQVKPKKTPPGKSKSS